VDLLGLKRIEKVFIVHLYLLFYGEGLLDEREGWDLPV